MYRLTRIVIIHMVLLASIAGRFVAADSADHQPAPHILPAGTIQHDADTLPWANAPASMPKGTRIVVLEGDPKTEEIFTLRVSVPAGSRLPPHWHPRDERVTILSGRVGVGFGDHVDESPLRYFEAGDYYVNPAHSHHFVYFPEASVVQITGLGPWEVHLIPSRLD